MIINKILDPIKFYSGWEYTQQLPEQARKIQEWFNTASQDPEGFLSWISKAHQLTIEIKNLESDLNTRTANLSLPLRMICKLSQWAALFFSQVDKTKRDRLLNTMNSKIFERAKRSFPLDCIPSDDLAKWSVSMQFSMGLMGKGPNASFSSFTLELKNNNQKNSNRRNPWDRDVVVEYTPYKMENKEESVHSYLKSLNVIDEGSYCLRASFTAVNYMPQETDWNEIIKIVKESAFFFKRNILIEDPNWKDFPENAWESSGYKPIHNFPELNKKIYLAPYTEGENSVFFSCPMGLPSNELVDAR